MVVYEIKKKEEKIKIFFYPVYIYTSLFSLFAKENVKK